MEQKHSNQLIQNNYPQRSSLLLCPDCQIGIPFLSLKRQTLKIMISMYCKCWEMEKEFLLPEYLTKIAQIKPLIMKCIEHNEQGNQYCLYCSNLLCVKYLNQHNRNSPSHILFEY